MAKIALFCLDVVGKSMAGPAIRYWEFAKALSKRHDVVLITPNKSELVSPEFTIVDRCSSAHTKYIAAADVLISQQIPPRLALRCKKNGVRLILDAYDPMPLENLEIFKHLPMKVREHKNRAIIEQFRFSFEMADAFLCANEYQRSLWMGMILALGRLTPRSYDQDSLLNQLIDIVPFGLPSAAPQPDKGVIRRRFGLSDQDKIVLWGGGIWNWFDPLSLIRAIKLLSGQRQDIKLIFMGVKHPNEYIPEMEMARQAVSLAKELELFDKHVFFNFGWLPYEERQGYLLDADVGASTHFEHLETRYAFRTRILDNIWATLPLVATAGDSFADLIVEKNLGIVVPYGDERAIAAAIARIVDDAPLRLAMKLNLAQLRPSFYWDKVVKPIERIVEHLMGEQAPMFSASAFSAIAAAYLRQRGPFALVRSVAAKCRVFSKKTVM